MSTHQPDHSATKNATLSMSPPAQTRRSYPLPEAEYSEIFRNSEFFNQKLQNFHKSYGSKFKIPTIGGSALDLHRLFVEVTSRGGIEKVVTDRKWKDVMMVFNFPSTITSASFTLRKYYGSLLYHFEQVYYFRKRFPDTLVADSVSGLLNGSSSAQHVLEDGASMHQSSANPDLKPDDTVIGYIDGKFDDGYLITVNLGSEQLKGVLYHTPRVSDMPQSSNTSRQSQKRLEGSSWPKANKHGYYFSFASKKKKVYQGRGLRDDERDRTEMLEIQSSNN